MCQMHTSHRLLSSEGVLKLRSVTSAQRHCSVQSGQLFKAQCRYREWNNVSMVLNKLELQAVFIWTIWRRRKEEENNIVVFSFLKLFFLSFCSSLIIWSILGCLLISRLFISDNVFVLVGANLTTSQAPPPLPLNESSDWSQRPPNRQESGEDLIFFRWSLLKLLETISFTLARVASASTSTARGII